MITDELMQKHHKSLSILRIIKVQEGKIKTNHSWIKENKLKGVLFYKENKEKSEHEIEIYTMSIKRLFERYELLQTKLT